MLLHVAFTWENWVLYYVNDINARGVYIFEDLESMHSSEYSTMNSFIVVALIVFICAGKIEFIFII